MKINTKNIDKQQQRLVLTRQELESNQLQGIKAILPPRRIDKICRCHGYHYRKRLITPLVTLLHMIGSAVSRERSFQSAWHNNGQVGCSDILCQARKRLPLRIWQGVDRWIDAEIAKEFDHRNFWRGHRLIGVDGSCVSMSDTPQLQEAFGRTESKYGPSRFPIGRVMFGFTLNTQVTIGHNLGHYRTSEQSLLKDMLKSFHEGDLIICDRHFAGANLYVQYKEASLEFITPLHQRQRVETLKKVKEHSANDFLVELPLTKKHIKENDNLVDPEKAFLRKCSLKTGSQIIVKRIAQPEPKSSCELFEVKPAGGKDHVQLIA